LLTLIVALLLVLLWARRGSDADDDL